MIKQDSVHDEKIICFALVYRVPVRCDLAHRVRTARIKRRQFILRRWRSTKHLRGTGLIETRTAPISDCVVSECLQEAKCPGGYYVSRVLGLIEADSDVGLGTQIVNFIGLNTFD